MSAADSAVLTFRRTSLVFGAVPGIFPSPKEQDMKTQRGFTLIEVMIVVAIVAILVTIAYPSYQDYLRKGRRAAAQSFMMEVANKQQQYLLDARQYALGSGAIGTLGLTTPTEVSSFYTLNVDPAVATTPPTFNITATPIAGSVQAPDGVLELNNFGAKKWKGNVGW
jgi:type IV pilus assembly protein PilE